MAPTPKRAREHDLIGLQIRGVHHVVLTVSDVARSTDFCEQVLGQKAFSGDDIVRCISGGPFLLCLQRAPRQPLPY